MSDGRWQVRWASDTDRDPRLVTELHVGPVARVAWHADGQRPLLAVHTREDEDYLVRVWDVLSGEPSDLPCTEPVYGMAFATLAGATVLVTAHDSAGLRIWSVAERRLITTVPVGDFPAVNLRVAEIHGHLQAVTLDNRGRVHRWSLPDGAYLGRLDAHVTTAIWAGRRADGRTVLLTNGDMSLWDLADGTRLPLRVPAQARNVRGVVLATVDGRDQVTVTDIVNVIVTFDPETGELLSPPLRSHRRSYWSAMTRLWEENRPAANLAVVDGVLAMPTAWRVYLGRGLPISGPVAHSMVQAVRFSGRDLLLTAAEYDGVVALWDLDRPVERTVGHEQRVSGVAVAGPGDTVVSLDEGGVVLARDGGGRLLTGPLATRIEVPAALAVWRDGESIMAVTSAGSRPVTDRGMRRWNVTTGEPYGPPVHASLTYAQRMAWAGETLVTLGMQCTLVLWRPDDGAVLAEIPTEVRSKDTGFVTGVVAGRPYAALSSYAQPLTLHALDDPAAAPIVIPQAGNDMVLAVAGDRVIVARFDRDLIRPRTLRAWTLAGDPAGPILPGPADIVAAVERAWPQMYVARADGTVLLLDLETGKELCEPMRLPRRPGAMAVTGDGDLVVGYGSDVAHLRPPA